MAVTKKVLAVFVMTMITCVFSNVIPGSEEYSEADNIGVRNCSLSVTGHDYIGHLAETVSGRTCQAWSAQSPHYNRFTEDHLFPDGSVEKARNYCRNPQNGHIGLWCYTTDPDTLWEECDVPTCACKRDDTGREYRGVVRSTTKGTRCQHWSSQVPHQHDRTDDSMFADGSIQLADNFCRNPDPEFVAGAWCFTVDPDVRWDMCDVPRCSPPCGRH